MIAVDDNGRIWMVCVRCGNRGLVTPRPGDSFDVQWNDSPSHRDNGMTLRQVLSDRAGCGFDRLGADGTYRCSFADMHPEAA